MPVGTGATAAATGGLTGAMAGLTGMTDPVSPAKDLVSCTHPSHGWFDRCRRTG